MMIEQKEKMLPSFVRVTSNAQFSMLNKKPSFANPRGSANFDSNYCCMKRSLSLLPVLISGIFLFLLSSVADSPIHSPNQFL
jgi:hypothetical protein